MRKLISIVLLGTLALFTGCIRSLHPIYTDEDLVFEPGLIGQWAEGDSKETWVFSSEGTNEYNLLYTEGDGTQGTFSAHLAKIKGKLFLDFFPADPELKQNNFYQLHLFPVHTFAYVKQIEPTLQMAFPDADWLEEHLHIHPDAIQHEQIEHETILTAATTALQIFWVRHTETKGAFEDPSNMHRGTSAHSTIQPNEEPLDVSPITPSIEPLQSTHYSEQNN